MMSAADACDDALPSSRFVEGGEGPVANEARNDRHVNGRSRPEARAPARSYHWLSASEQQVDAPVRVDVVAADEIRRRREAELGLRPPGSDMSHVSDDGS